VRTVHKVKDLLLLGKNLSSAIMGSLAWTQSIISLSLCDVPLHWSTSLLWIAQLAHLVRLQLEKNYSLLDNGLDWTCLSGSNVQQIVVKQIHLPFDVDQTLRVCCLKLKTAECTLLE
jgi:hypothetical protein